MKQTILTKTGSKTQTKLERLYAIRKALYKDINEKMKLLQVRKRDLILSYRQDVKDIDKEIDKEIINQKK